MRHALLQPGTAHAAALDAQGYRQTGVCATSSVAKNFYMLFATEDQKGEGAECRVSKRPDNPLTQVAVVQFNSGPGRSPT